MHTQTPPLPHPQAQPARRLAGFTLMEVLVALGLFTLGFVAIAALLPAGALLQRETADDIQSRHLERNAEAVITGTPIDQTKLFNAYYSSGTDPGDVTDLRSFDELNGTDFENFWTMADRSFPASVTDPEQRMFYWLPLVRDTDPGDTSNQKWEIVVFILRRDGNVKYDEKLYPLIADEPNTIPGLAKMNIALDGVNNDVFTLDNAIDGLRENDWIVDDQGTDYRVLNINGNDVRVNTVIDDTVPLNFIWYAPSGEDVDSGRLGRSPAVRVFKIPRDGKALNLN